MDHSDSFFGAEPDGVNLPACVKGIGGYGIPPGHRLAKVLSEAMSEPQFAKQWCDDADKSFRPFAAAALDLGNVKRTAEESRRAIYRDLCLQKRGVMLAGMVGKPVPSKVLKLLSRTNWKEFSRRDWGAFISVASGTNNSKLGYVPRITPTLVRQFHLIPADLQVPALYRVICRLKIPAERWQQLGDFINRATATQRAEFHRAAEAMNSNGDFWDLYHRCEGMHYRPFNIPASVFESKLLAPLASAREMEVEARRMKSCLANQVSRVRDGDRIYFKFLGNVLVNTDLVKQVQAWVPGDILGYENAPVAPKLARQLAVELSRLAQTISVDGASPIRRETTNCIAQLRRDARISFATDEITHLSGILKSIRGKSRSWTDGAYAIIEVSRNRYVQFMSSPDGKEYLMEISSHKYVKSVNSCLSADAVSLLEKVGFVWPTERTNYFRWFKTSGSDDIQAMAELALAMLSKLFGYRSGQAANITAHFPT